MSTNTSGLFDPSELIVMSALIGSSYGSDTPVNCLIFPILASL